uniref:Sigma B outer capsid clamp protein n=1 Tax=Cataraqui virus TaxID=2776967 RepID=A0A8E4QJ88_9REOV|nr:MAG: sigma B outer capsid clamp protein [Cataraqui virus]QPB10696.1 MAG: sigma B outer capsid clamp protein [Cataraqui virus]
MEVRAPNFHSYVEAIVESYQCQPKTWNARTLWANDEYHFPDVIKVGNAYCCSICCGVLYYGSLPNDGIAFPHHKCHQQHNEQSAPLLSAVKIGRTTEHLMDEYSVLLAGLVDHVEESPSSDQSSPFAMDPFDISLTTDHIRTDTKIQPDFWTYPIERRADVTRPNLALQLWRIQEVTSQRQCVPTCFVTSFFHTKHVFKQMMDNMSIYDIATSGKSFRLQPQTAQTPTRRDGRLTLSIDNYDYDMEDIWNEGWATSPMLGGVGITATYERGGCHNIGHPMISAGKKCNHYKSLFHNAARGWNSNTFKTSLGLNAAEAEARLVGHASTMLERTLPPVFNPKEDRHMGQTSGPLMKVSTTSFVRCVY